MRLTPSMNLPQPLLKPAGPVAIHRHISGQQIPLINYAPREELLPFVRSESVGPGAKKLWRRRKKINHP